MIWVSENIRKLLFNFNVFYDFFNINIYFEIYIVKKFYSVVNVILFVKFLLFIFIWYRIKEKVIFKEFL